MGIAPKITTTIVDTNTKTIGLTGDITRLIRYHSNAQATMKVIAQEDDAAINLDLLIIDNGSERGFASGSNDIYHYTFEKVESDTFTFYATDDRNNEASETVKVDMVNYVKLTCNMANSRPDANGDMYLSCSGSCFNGYFDETNSSNFNYLEVTYSYTGSGVDTEKYSSYGSGSMIVSRSGNTYSAYANLSRLDYQATYSFEITAEDELETVTSIESGVKSKPIFHWGENDFAFGVPVNFNSTAETRFKGNMRLKGDGNYGNTLYFGDGSLCYISEPDDDEMTLKADIINLSVGEMVAINRYPVWGTWTPTLNYSSAVSYYDIQSGWYQRLGNVITIGWQIKAYIRSGYEDTELTITEIPALPQINAFGGGVAYGIYVPANKVFECWCIDTNARITARLQPCNNTSAGNLNVSSTCYYPEGGGYVTLAGTICYMTN